MWRDLGLETQRVDMIDIRLGVCVGGGDNEKEHCYCPRVESAIINIGRYSTDRSCS